MTEFETRKARTQSLRHGAYPFDYIRNWDPMVAEILSVMSMLDAQAIPEFLIRFGNNKLKFSKAMGTLQAFSLIFTGWPS